MSPYSDVSAGERHLLSAALHAPLVERDPTMLGMCLRLCGRKLLQRAGLAAAANGWTGSPDAFVLTQDGWNLLKAERLAPPVRKVG